MVELATADAPDVVCLQELPLWSLPRLEAWSGMGVRSVRTKRGSVPVVVGYVLQHLDARRFRSAITGQANAILVAERLEILEHRSRQVSERGRERRVAHAVRLPGLVVGNVHASNDFRDPDVPRAEVARAQALVDELAGPGDTRVLAGDFNLRDGSLPGPGIDHVVVLDGPHGPLEVWPEARRRHNAAVLSDHAPVEVRLG
jgi:endonuclease/exonuclease/phosphatase family metal-dependent hydrolase